MAAHHRKLWLCAGVIAALFVAFICFHNTREKRLERTLMRAWSGAEARQQQGVSPRNNLAQLNADLRLVLAGTGTNLVPLLLDWIEANSQPQTALQTKAVQAADRLPVESETFFDWGTGATRRRRALVAQRALVALGTDARSAIPRLRDLRANATTTYGRAFAENTLRLLGEKD